jgi:D-alanyl-D-alanine carboxypeptidase (penicillin-binding protein 5/6)
MGFKNYRMLTVMEGGEAISQAIRVKGGRISVLRAVLGTPAEVVIMRSAENQVKSSIHLKNSVWAPLKKGDRLGELNVTLDEKTLGKFPLISNQDVEQSDILKRLLDSVF